MKLTNLQPEKWFRSAPFVDTLILPISPVRVNGKLFHQEERVRMEKVCSEVEKRLMGRVLLLPMLHYLPQEKEKIELYLSDVINQLGDTDFTYLFLVVDEVVGEVEVSTKNVTNLLHVDFYTLSSSSQDTDLVEQNVEQLVSSILDIWSKDSQ